MISESRNRPGRRSLASLLLSSEFDFPKAFSLTENHFSRQDLFLYNCPQESPAETQVEAVELQVQELHRDGPGQGLPPEALHRGAAQAPVRQGLAAGAPDEDTDEGSDRQDEEAQGKTCSVRVKSRVRTTNSQGN